MDLGELTTALRSGSLWVRRSRTCTACGEDPPEWLAVRLENGRLRSEWLCPDCCDPRWRRDRFDVLDGAPDPTILLALPVEAPHACALRPDGPSGPLCGAPEEYLAVYVFGTPDGRTRTGAACGPCMRGLECPVGDVLVLATGIGDDRTPA